MKLYPCILGPLGEQDGSRLEGPDGTPGPSGPLGSPGTSGTQLFYF